MEVVILIIILAAVVVWLIYLLVRYVIAPVAGWFLSGLLAFCFGYSLYTSIRSFVTAFIYYKDPYASYEDKSPDAPPGSKRNYFFGPGYRQMTDTIGEAFSLQKKHLEKLEKWKDKHLKYTWLWDIWIWILYCIMVFCTAVIGNIWLLIFSLVLLFVLATGLCVFFIFFMSLWGVDRLLLMLKSIQSRCSQCKRKSVVPVFICPGCGVEHRRLTPGPYGIFRRKCTCGYRLVTTYFNGRSGYKAVCPFCASELAVSDAQQYGIQLVGGVSAGKTTFLAAFWHEYLARLKANADVSTTAAPVSAFNELEYWFHNGVSSPTTETNANMYSLIHDFSDKTAIQMTIYDVSGEVFESLSNDTQQQQFKYCEGIAFVIDPASNTTDVSETISGFLREFSGLKGKGSNKTSDVPVAVVISKADLYKREIGLPKIKATHKSNAQKYADADGNVSIEQTRCGVCRDFLEKHGFNNTLNIIDSELSNVQYFSSSAMGHQSTPGTKYEPWGVMEPVLWLLQQKSDMFEDISL